MDPIIDIHPSCNAPDTTVTAGPEVQAGSKIKHELDDVLAASIRPNRKPLSLRNVRVAKAEHLRPVDIESIVNTLAAMVRMCESAATEEAKECES